MCKSKHKLEQPPCPKFCSRFWSKVEKFSAGGCWEWMGCKLSSGYGLIGLTVHGKKLRLLSHRCAYEICIGEIKEGLVLDHLCRNHSCCNPDHLEAVTQKENVNRGRCSGVARKRQIEKTHCVNGHEFSPENTRLSKPSNGTAKRRCLACGRERDRRRRETRRKHLSASRYVDVV